MATILDEDTGQFFIIEKEEDTQTSHIEELEDNNVSHWVKDQDIIRPSSSVSVYTKLESGMYTVDYNRDLGFYCSKMKVNSDELFVFSDSVAPSLLEEIKLFWKKQDLYKENKLIHKRGILVEGYSGTGKSSLVSQISNDLIKQGGIVFKVQNFKNLDDYVSFMRIGFRKIQPTTPIITILEDLEQYREVEASLLDFLDGKTNLNHHIVIATTNNTKEIPDTFLRPSRIDLRIEILMPSDTTRREYFEKKNVPSYQLDILVEKSKDCSLADLKEIYICVFLLEYSIEEALEKVTKPRNKKNYLTSPNKKQKFGI